MPKLDKLPYADTSVPVERSQKLINDMLRAAEEGDEMMTNDQRMLRLTKEEWDAINDLIGECSHLPNGSDDHREIPNSFFIKYWRRLSNPAEDGGRPDKFDDLEPVPQHTDADYDDMSDHMAGLMKDNQELNESLMVSRKLNATLSAEHDELKAQLSGKQLLYDYLKRDFDTLVQTASKERDELKARLDDRTEKLLGKHKKNCDTCESWGYVPNPYHIEEKACMGSDGKMNFDKVCHEPDFSYWNCKGHDCREYDELKAKLAELEPQRVKMNKLPPKTAFKIDGWYKLAVDYNAELERLKKELEWLRNPARNFNHQDGDKE